MSGKGDTYRPVDPKKWATEYERIFQKPADDRTAADFRVVFEASYVMYDAHLRHRPEPDTLPKHTQEGHGESDPAERKEIR